MWATGKPPAPRRFTAANVASPRPKFARQSHKRRNMGVWVERGSQEQEAESEEQQEKEERKEGMHEQRQVREKGGARVFLWGV